MIGLLVILPLAGICVWLIKSCLVRFFKGDWSTPWQRTFWVSLAAGICLGGWFGFGMEWERVQFRRFPIPVARFDPETRTWTELDMPKPVKTLAVATDCLAGVALALFPVGFAMSIVEFQKETRRLSKARED